MALNKYDVFELSITVFFLSFSENTLKISGAIILPLNNNNGAFLHRFSATSVSKEMNVLLNICMYAISMPKKILEKNIF